MKKHREDLWSRSAMELDKRLQILRRDVAFGEYFCVYQFCYLWLRTISISASYLELYDRVYTKEAMKQYMNTVVRQKLQVIPSKVFFEGEQSD